MQNSTVRKQEISTVAMRRAALSAMVLSVSGWRAVFADHDEATTTALSLAHRDLLALATRMYLEIVPPGPVLVATDTRPTGRAIARVVLPTCSWMERTPRYLGVATAPEVYAHAERTACAGFVYVSASHNPVGYNGLKLGDPNGGVLQREAALDLIAAFRQRIDDQEGIERIVAGIAATPVARELEPHAAEKHVALQHYREVVLRSVFGEERETACRAMRAFFARNPCGIVEDYNGSARAASLDATLCADFNVAFAGINDRPGAIAHQILPEGRGLVAAAETLAALRSTTPSFAFAFTPDNDGDRGNVVFPDGRALDAQSVFALAVKIELAWARRCGAGRLAVAANGPTSIRIDRICRDYDAELRRAEVGEANVVQLGHQLRAAGYTCPIMGEGSNGGTILYPARVRDPLATVLSLLKARAFALFGPEARDYAAMVTALPRFSTLETDDPRAKMQIGAHGHAELKRRYEELLPAAVPAILPHLEEGFGPLHHAVINYEGGRTRPGVGNRSGAQTGGLRVVFSDRDGVDRAAVWMRGSGTEPVYRVLADVEGEDAPLLDRLIAWQRDLVGRSVAAAG